MKMLTILVALQSTPVGYNGDDYMGPDVRERRLERQEQRRDDEQRWLRQKEERDRWLDSISPLRK